MARIEKKREEIEAKQYEAEQEALGKQNAKISAEVGRPIEYTLIPGDQIAFPFLAQFTHVDIQIEPRKDIILSGQYEGFLKPFKGVSLSNRTVRKREVVRRILHSDGFIKVKASMQGENSFTIRPVENFTMEVLIHPGKPPCWLSQQKSR